MRDLLLYGIVFGALPIVLIHPWIGTMLWTWISLMNPHRLAWGTAFAFPFAAVVAGATLIGVVLTRDYRRLPLDATTFTLGAFVVWMCVTSVFALYPDQIGEMFRRVMKVQFMVFVTLALLHTRKQVEIFLWVIVISIGFYGIKGGIFTLLHGGTYRVWGPVGSFIEGNNELALALIVIIPIMHYLRSIQPREWVRWSLVAAMILCALAALGSQSRGAFIAIAAMSFMFWLRTRQKKLLSGIVLLVVGACLIAFMPVAWEQRMRTIEAYDQDSSAKGRLNAWVMAYRLAKDHPLGGGFEVTTPEMFARYAPVPTDIHAAHSIYFQVLGEHGFLGLALFLLLWWFTWRSTRWVSKYAASDGETIWAADLARMLQASLFGYLVGGAFLSLAYFDLPYGILIVAVVCRRIVETRVIARAPAPKSAADSSAVVPNG